MTGEEDDMATKVNQLERELAKVKKLEKELGEMKQQLSAGAGSSAALAAAPALTSNIGVKTTIKIPELLPKMTFSDYKYEVENWVAYAGNHIKKEDHAWLLLNQLPAVDDKMIKRTVIDSVTMDVLKTEEGVTKMLETMKSVLECEPFTRLVEWLQAWEQLSQGSKSYEKYTTMLRKLAKAAKDDFKFTLPDTFLVAKLLLGCSAVKGNNIAMITAGVDMNGLDDTLYTTVEAKLKGFIGTAEAFNHIKPSGGASNQVYFTAKDVYGNPIYSPDKVAFPSPTQGAEAIQAVTEEEKHHLNEQLIAFRKGGSQGGARSRLGNKVQVQETKEERRARMIQEGKCFEFGCSNPTAHVFENCPTRAKRLERKKQEVLAKGGQWFDDPKDARRNKEAAEGKGGAKRAYVQSKAIINPPDGNIDLEINISEDEMQDMIFHSELDQQDYDRYFKRQKRILVAKQFNMNEKVHSVHFTESRSDEALIDSGCEKNCAGTVAYDKFLRTLSPEDRAQVREFEGSSQFKFGGAGIYGSLKEVLVPVYIAGSKMWMRMDIVDTDIPILVGLPVLKQLELGIQYANRGQDYGYFQSQRFKIFHRGGHHYFKISKQGSMDSLDPEASQDKVFTTFVGKVRVIDNDKVKSQLKQLHTNFAHVNKLKMIEMLKAAGGYEPDMEPVMDKILEECPVKRCRQNKYTQSNPKAAIRHATHLGDIVTADLKIRSEGKSIMYIIDQATSYACGALIDNKSSEECSRVLVRSWYGTGKPRIRTLLTDNGREWVGPQFKEILRRFSTTRKFTVPYHPEMNGTCERVHSLIDLNMQSLKEGDPNVDDETCLIWALNAYNMTPTSTGLSPSQMVHGIRSVLEPPQDITPVQAQEPDCNDRYVKELFLRQAAIEQHNIIRNSRKLRELVLSRSKPTPEPKKIGTWVWFRRQGQWKGPAQVGASIAGECSVREGNEWVYNCKHSELLPLNEHELEVHNLSQDKDEQEDKDEQQQSANQQAEEDPEKIIEVEYTLDNLLQQATAKPSNPSCNRDLPGPRNPSPWSGNSTRRSSSQNDNPIQDEAGPSQDQPTEEGQSREESTRKSVEWGMGGPLSDTVPDLISDTSNSESSSGYDTSGDMATAEVVQQTPEQTGARKKTPPINIDSNKPPNRPQGRGRPRNQQPSNDFDQNLFNRPTVDASTSRLRPSQQVKILNPTTKQVEHVKILHGYSKPAARSCYRVEGPNGKGIFDFNKIVWDYDHATNYFTQRARIEPDQVHTVLHTIIHPSQHNLPGVVEAKAKEVQGHVDFGTFELVKEADLSPQQLQKVIPATWVVVYKGIPGKGKIKARLCARGDREPDVDQIRTDAPTASKDSIRILLSVAASKGWKISSLDFKNAFVQGKVIDRELYMKPPPDLRASNPGMLLKIIKRLYGLRDAARGWIQEVRDCLLGLGMMQSNMDRAVYLYIVKGELMGIIVTHIDDFLYIGNEIFHEKVINKVLEKYVIGALETESFTFTGWELTQSHSGITLTQRDYLQQISLDHYAHMRSFTCKDSQLLGESDQSLYRKMCGVLNWLVTSSKPSLAHTSSVMSGKLGKATKADAKSLLRTLEKAKGEPEVLKFSNLGDPKKWEIDLFADAALGKSQDPESYIGDISFIRGPNGLRNVVNWNSGKLDVPTASILNAEAEAITNAHGKIKYIRFILNEMFNLEMPATMFTDSRSLFQTVTSDNSIRNRRISAAIATIRAVKTAENITLRWLKGVANISDSLTRPNANTANLKHLLSTGKTLSSFPIPGIG